MGNVEGSSNTRSSNSYGSIYIQTDKKYYIAGPTEPVTGNIHLNLTKDYPAASVNLKIKGKEKSKFYKYEYDWYHSEW